MSLDVDVFNKERTFTRLHAIFTSRTDQNGKDLVAYVEHKRIYVSPRRLLEYYIKVGIFEQYMDGKDFRDLTKEELPGMFAALKERKGRHNAHISPRSLNNYKDELKHFLKFLGKNEVAAAIKNERMSQLNDLTSEDMLTMEDVSALIRSVDGERNKAIIALLSEAGNRPSELFNLQIKDLHLSSQANTITFFGKKRKRTRPLISSVPYLVAWLNKHPRAGNPVSALFVKRNGEVMGYRAVQKIVQLAFKRAGIKKPATLKIFRHSVNTVLYGAMSEENVRQLQGHVPGSQMARHYSHLNSQRVSDSYSAMFGLKPKESIKPLLMPRSCNVCGFENKPEMEVCEQCKRPLSLKSAMEMSNPNTLIQEALNEDSGLLKQLEERITERIVREVEQRLHENDKKGIFGGIEIEPPNYHSNHKNNKRKPGRRS
jgi:integrase/recombinase XerD